jgi:hypothetical protein
LVIRGSTLKVALAGCVVVAFRADVIIMGMCGIHMRKPFAILANITKLFFSRTTTEKAIQQTANETSV